MSVILRGGSAETHASASPGAVDYVLDEVRATPYVALTSGEVAVFDGAATATLLAATTRVGANANTGAAGTFGTAVGFNATASGINSAAFGANATASGLNSTAVRGTASGSNSAALGAGSTASAASAIALGHTAVASAAGAIAIGQNATASAADAITIGASYLRGNMVTAKHLSPAAAVGVDLGTSSLPFGSLFAGLRVTDWAYQRYPTTGGNGGITTAAVTSTTGNVPVAFASGAGDTAKATVSGFTNTGVLSVAAVPYQRTFFVVIRGLLRYNSPGGDGTNDRGAVLYIPGSSATTTFSVVAPQAKSQDGGYQHRTGAGFVTVLSGAAFTFAPRIASAGGLNADVIQVEYFVMQV